MQRGKQYIRAIQLYYRKFNAYPPNVDALVKTNNIRFLRKKYVDPTTGKEEWKPVMFGQNKTPQAMGFFGQPLAAAAGAGIGPSGGNAQPGAIGAGPGLTSSAGNGLFNTTTTGGSTDPGATSPPAAGPAGGTAGGTDANGNPTTGNGQTGGATGGSQAGGTSPGTGSTSTSNPQAARRLVAPESSGSRRKARSSRSTSTRRRITTTSGSSFTVLSANSRRRGAETQERSANPPAAQRLQLGHPRPLRPQLRAPRRIIRRSEAPLPRKALSRNAKSPSMPTGFLLAKPRFSN